MKIHMLIFMILLILLAIPHGTVYGENRIEYTIQVSNDGSALWIVKETGTNVTVSLDPLGELKNKLAPLVEAAKNKTERRMAVNNDTLSVTSTFLGSYVTVEYQFYWINFSKIENTNIVIGDAFLVQNFFLHLYGEGTIYLTYPSGYIVESVSPPPYKRDDSRQILEWPGTNDFNNEGATIILTEKSASSGLSDTLAQNAILIVSLSVLAAGSSVGFYTFRRRKKKEAKTAKPPEFPGLPGIESDEEKIVKLLKSSSESSLYQSAITEQCRFSKAKTSQLLAVLENKGMIRRYKKGRDKIVVLVQREEK
jgi:uncharacterized membrane protein